MARTKKDFTTGQLEAVVAKLGVANIERIIGGDGRKDARVISLVLETEDFKYAGEEVLPDVNGHRDMIFTSITWGDGLKDYPLSKASQRERIASLPALTLLLFRVFNRPMRTDEIYEHMQPNVGGGSDSLYVWLRRLATTIQLHECGEARGRLARTVPNLFLVGLGGDGYRQCFLYVVWNAGDKTWRIDMVGVEQDKKFPQDTLVFVQAGSYIG